jgi:putative addiction module component (TIGR02574 family)
MNVKATAEEIANWSTEDRLELIGLVWDTIVQQGGSLLTEAQFEEIERRAQAHEKDPSGSLSLREFEEKLRSQRQ